MQSIVAPSGINRRVLLSTLAMLPAFSPRAAMAQQTPPAASSAFSFAVYGDSRPMMYLCTDVQHGATLAQYYPCHNLMSAIGT